MRALSLATSAVCLLGCVFSTQLHAELPVDKLNTVVEARSAADKQRDIYRNPGKTVAFFQIEPGMTVAEVLPGGGWYTRVLAPYLGADGTLYGINYVDEMWPLFGFMDEKRIQRQIGATKAYASLVEKTTDNGMKAEGFTFATVPDDVKGTVDRVLFIRAMHNLARFNAQAGTLKQALTATYDMLKDGGLAGVVQHRAPADASAEWSDGSRGYLSEKAVIEAFENAGFELVARSEINANDNDKPGAEDRVWRLPPSLSGSADDDDKRAAMKAIGESDRMTLLFKKPSKES